MEAEGFPEDLVKVLSLFCIFASGPSAFSAFVPAIVGLDHEVEVPTDDGQAFLLWSDLCSEDSGGSGSFELFRIVGACYHVDGVEVQMAKWAREAKSSNSSRDNFVPIFFLYFVEIFEKGVGEYDADSCFRCCAC